MFYKNLAATLLALSLIGCGAETIETQSQAIVDGTAENGRDNVVYLYNLAGSSCTGTIIAPRVVLTAKHCVRGGQSSAAPARQFRVLVGSSTRSFFNQYFVSEVLVAPGQWDLQDGTDVAVLILSSPAEEEPIPVSFDDPRTITGQSFTAVGFGQTPNGGSGRKFTTNKTVDGVRRNYIFVRPSVCSGDSGGPLLGPDGRIWGVASFIYSETNGPPQCGSAPGAYNSINNLREFIEGAIEASGACVPREEICNGQDDNCDGVIDEGCTPNGSPCTNPTECAGGLCEIVGQSQSPICTTECDVLTPTFGCPAGMYCAPNNGDCTGRCAPGTANGTTELDQDCTADTDCISGLCSDPGDGRRRCLTPCGGDRGMCFANEVCVALPGSCGGCVPRALVASQRGLAEPCDDNAECRSGICSEESYCTQACTTTADCGDEESFHCRAGLCARGPLEGLGGGCTVNEDCASGICAAEGDRKWCTAFCETDASCIEGLSCVPVGERKVCAPSRSLVGEPCVEGVDCVSGLCAGTPNGQVCTRFCEDTPCSPGFECIRVDGTGVGVCVAPPPKDDVLPEDEGGCSVARHQSEAPLGALLLILGCVIGRVRRP